MNFFEHINEEMRMQDEKGTVIGEKAWKMKNIKKIKLILYATRMLKNLKKILCLCFILTSKLKNDA